MKKDLYTKGRKNLEERFNEASLKYRREEKLYELHDAITKISYWIKKNKKGKLILVRVSDYHKKFIIK